MEQQLTQLEEALGQQIGAHERLAGLVRQKLAALRQAQQAKVAALTQQENQVLQAIGELEKRRIMLVAGLTQRLQPAATRPWRLEELAQNLPEPSRGRLLVLRTQLRQQIELVRQESSIVRSVSEALLRHMNGLVQSLGSAMTGVGTYTRGGGGGPPPPPTAMSTFNATA
ncbi:MAG: flagellar export chaperone FlgN [Phycisphaeraceae bacterium]